MTNYRQTAPRIRWGSGYVNALDLAYPLDNATAWSAKREGSVDVQGPSGVEDSWTIGIDYLLRGDARWIPQADVVGPPKATGWDGSAGFRAFLEWARDKNLLYFHPDGRNLIASPKMNVDSNADGTVDDFTLGYSPGLTVTASLDAPNAAQKVVLSAGVTAANELVDVTQNVSGILAGESLTFSFEYEAASLVNCEGHAYLQFLDANNNALAAPDLGGLTAGTFTRVSLSGIAPANTASAKLYLRVLTFAAGATGTLRWRNAMLRRNGVTDPTFIDNPFITSYLLDPHMTRSAISLEPAAAQETDGTRRFTLMLRNTGSPYDGY